MPVLLDSNQQIGKAADAKVTPEAFVIDGTGTIRYRGLINNLYAGFGKKRPAPTKHHLRYAIEAVLTGNPVATKQTKPIGCFIYYESNER